MAVILTTSLPSINKQTNLGSIQGYLGSSQSEDDRSQYYYYFAYYSKLTATTARIYVTYVVDSTGSESVSNSGTFRVTLDGSSKTKATSYSVSVKGRTSYLTNITFDVEYSDTGTWANKSISLRFKGNMESTSTVSNTISLPDIDPIPSGSITSSIYQGGFEGNIIAGITVLQESISYIDAKRVVGSYNGAGITSEETLLNSKTIQTGSVSRNFITPTNNENYVLTLTGTISNNTGSVTETTTQNVKGYTVPLYGDQTSTSRCNAQGQPDSQGEYGRLYLTWKTTSIGTNSLQSYQVKLNNSVITPISGSISDGYLEYLFPLAQNVQGNLEIYLEDKISSNTITSLAVSKAINPLSLYQSGDSVGVAIGRICTESGFWCYEQFYLKSSSTGSIKIFNIQVDDNGQITATEV